MAHIYPFQAVRPQPQHAEAVASPPYDVLSSDEARVLAQNNPHSFLHITKSEIDLPVDLNTYDQSVYEKARSNFSDLIEKGILFQEPHSCYYLYELIMEGRSGDTVSLSLTMVTYHLQTSMTLVLKFFVCR